MRLIIIIVVIWYVLSSEGKTQTVTTDDHYTNSKDDPFRQYQHVTMSAQRLLEGVVDPFDADAQEAEPSWRTWKRSADMKAAHSLFQQAVVEYGQLMRSSMFPNIPDDVCGLMYLHLFVLF